MLLRSRGYLSRVTTLNVYAHTVYQLEMSVLRFSQTQSTCGHTQDLIRQFPATSIEHSFGYPCPIATVCWRSQSCINTPNGSLALTNILYYLSLSSLLYFTCISPPSTCSPMNTRAKNKSKHPAAPVMTPAQLAAAGISQQKRSKKKPTKDQHIAALEEDLRATRELLRMVILLLPL